MTTYYWKAHHIPSDQWLVNHIAGGILHTNRIGSKWDKRQTLERILKRKINKFVKGPQTIKFEKEDWELQQYVVSLRKTVKL